MSEEIEFLNVEMFHSILVRWFILFGASQFESLES